MRVKRFAFWFAAIVVGVVGLYFVATAVQVFAAAGRSTTKPADAIVVLGAAQFDGRPSPVLKSRLDHAFALWQQGLANTVVVTGGNKPGDRFTEGGVSSSYLRDLGVPASAIVVEEEGSTTYESLENVAPVLEARGIARVIYVSDAYHVARIEAIGDSVGIDGVSSPVPDSASSKWTLARAYLREILGLGVGRIVGFDRIG